MINLKYLLSLSTLGFFFSQPVFAVDVVFAGVSHSVITDKVASSTGLDAVYTVYDMSEVEELVFENVVSPNSFKVSVYSNLGGGFAQDVPVVIKNGKPVVLSPRGNIGYIVEDGDKRICFWVLDYSTSPFDVTTVVADDEQDCEYTRINVEGRGEPLRYYSINGRSNTLSRGITVSYQTLEWNETDKVYLSVGKEAVFESLETPLIIRPAFYCGTSVTVSGDRFLRAWGMEKIVESGTIQPNGMEVHTEAVQTNMSDSEDSNQIKTEDSLLGGSAPADFVFYAYTTDAVIHNEWQISDDQSFEYIRYRFNEQDLTYSFNEEGRYYVRFVGSNEDGSCEVVGDVYEIGIGASDLRIPNAFSPDGDGVNDIWKVAYRSLVEFRCWIFDRNGNQLYFFDRPDMGWDGKYKGKTVGPGVYFYVIEAKGADGVRYKKGGDINILRYRKVGNSSAGSDPTE